MGAYSTGYFDTVFDRFEIMLATMDSDDAQNGDGSTAVRAKMISAGMETYFSTGGIGAGLANSNLITKKNIGRETYLHNNYVELLACTGTIGFCLYYGIYVVLLIKIIKDKNRDACSIALLLVILLLDFGNVNYYEIKTATYMLLLMLLTLKQERKLENE